MLIFNVRDWKSWNKPAAGKWDQGRGLEVPIVQGGIKVLKHQQCIKFQYPYFGQFFSYNTFGTSRCQEGHTICTVVHTIRVAWTEWKIQK